MNDPKTSPGLVDQFGRLFLCVGIAAICIALAWVLVVTVTPPPVAPERSLGEQSGDAAAYVVDVTNKAAGVK